MLPIRLCRTFLLAQEELTGREKQTDRIELRICNNKNNSICIKHIEEILRIIQNQGFTILKKLAVPFMITEFAANNIRNRDRFKI